MTLEGVVVLKQHALPKCFWHFPFFFSNCRCLNTSRSPYPEKPSLRTPSNRYSSFRAHRNVGRWFLHSDHCFICHWEDMLTYAASSWSPAVLVINLSKWKLQLVYDLQKCKCVLNDVSFSIPVFWQQWIKLCFIKGRAIISDLTIPHCYYHFTVFLSCSGTKNCNSQNGVTNSHIYRCKFSALIYQTHSQRG